jgi:sigma-B regulation protein RsbU (phosphoserine phosphatase)
MLHSGDPADALERVNKILCEDNPRSMFVTTLIYSLDLTTGQMLYANGGHNPPLLAVSNEPYQFMKLAKGIPPGMLEESKYKMCLLQLNPGDKLYLYTDGVNEAMNQNGEQFGNDRFLSAANKFRELPPEQFDEAIRREARTFAGGAEQSDDITSVAVLYMGKGREDAERSEAGGFLFDNEITVGAKLEELERVQLWVEGVLEKGEYPAKVRNQIEVSVEELFVNIASYAYSGKAGEVSISAGLDGRIFVMRFEDSGAAFNPLEHEAPDTKTGIEDRQIGGLGIHIVRKWMDEIVYKRDNGRNILTLYKTTTEGV